jgi:hypothetical protein
MTAQRHPRWPLAALLALSCGGDDKEQQPDVCAEYAAALGACFAEVGLEHRPGQGYPLACEDAPLTPERRAYFTCVTEALEVTPCDLAEGLWGAREAVGACAAELEGGA